MNSLYANTVKREVKTSLIILAVTFFLLSVVLFMQSIKFASSLWVLLEFGYGEWEKYLPRVLDNLKIWAVATGVIFALQFLIHSPVNDRKKMLSGMGMGLVVGFIFTYLLVLVIGIVIYIPLGIISIFRPEIIKFATLEFAWLVAAYIIFIFIAVDTPWMLFYAIKKGNWYFKLMGMLLAILLGIQIIQAILSGLLIIMENSIWRTNTFVIAMGASLLTTIITNLILIRREAIAKVIFVIITVYVASIITGNVSYGVFHWGELPSLILASFVGPIAYSFAAKIIINHPGNAILSIFGLGGGIAIGLFIAQYSKLRIVGQGWFGILCGTVITLFLAVGFGLTLGSTINTVLTANMRLKPEIGIRIATAFLLGIVLGMVLGGFLAR